VTSSETSAKSKSSQDRELLQASSTAIDIAEAASSPLNESRSLATASDTSTLTMITTSPTLQTSTTTIAPVKVETLTTAVASATLPKTITYTELIASRKNPLQNEATITSADTTTGRIIKPTTAATITSLVFRNKSVNFLYYCQLFL